MGSCDKKAGEWEIYSQKVRRQEVQVERIRACVVSGRERARRGDMSAECSDGQDKPKERGTGS